MRPWVCKVSPLGYWRNGILLLVFGGRPELLPHGPRWRHGFLAICFPFGAAVPLQSLFARRVTGYCAPCDVFYFARVVNCSLALLEIRAKRSPLIQMSLQINIVYLLVLWPDHFSETESSAQ